jgi:hypothetical protein
MVSQINQLRWDYEIYYLGIFNIILYFIYYFTNMHHYKYENHEYEHSCCHAMNYQHD